MMDVGKSPGHEERHLEKCSRRSGGVGAVVGADMAAATKAAIERMKPEAIYAVGGPSVVPQAALDAAAALAPGAKVERVAGADRYATSLQIGKKFFGLEKDKAAKRFLASGLNFPDALAGGALAGKEKAPLLLVPADPSHENVTFAKGGDTTVLGGPGVVSEAVAQAAGATKRFAGADRFATAKAVLDGGFAGATQAIYASAMNFPDALAAVPVAATKGVPLYLSGQSYTPQPLDLPGWVVGGPQAVADKAWSTKTPPQPTKLDINTDITKLPDAPNMAQLKNVPGKWYSDEGINDFTANVAFLSSNHRILCYDGTLDDGIACTITHSSDDAMKITVNSQEFDGIKFQLGVDDINYFITHQKDYGITEGLNGYLHELSFSSIYNDNDKTVHPGLIVIDTLADKNYLKAPGWMPLRGAVGTPENATDIVDTGYYERCSVDPKDIYGSPFKPDFSGECGYRGALPTGYKISYDNVVCADIGGIKCMDTRTKRAFWTDGTSYKTWK